MSCAYNEIYLSDAMRNLGEMTEYAKDACDQSMDHTFRCFVISGYAERFGRGDPQVVAGISGTELYMSVMERCGVTGKWPGALIRYDTDESYWIGYIMAFAQWKMGISFRQLFSVIKSDDLHRIYPALHTVSDDRAFEGISELYRKRTLVTRLQTYRKLAGMTQSDLANASGVNLRTLQQYEIGGKSISKASADKVITMARVLNCRPEDLIT